MFFQHFKKNRIVKDTVGYCCSKKKFKQRLIHSPQTASGVETCHQNFSLT